MAVYKTINAHNGVRYMKDGRMISERIVPANVVKLLETQPEVDDTDLPVDRPMRRCVFCKQQATCTRFINLQTIDLCEEDYYGKTTGQIVQQLRGGKPSEQEDEAKEGHETKDDGQEEDVQNVQDRVLEK